LKENPIGEGRKRILIEKKKNCHERNLEGREGQFRALEDGPRGEGKGKN